MRINPAYQRTYCVEQLENNQASNSSSSFSSVPYKLLPDVRELRRYALRHASWYNGPASATSVLHHHQPRSAITHTKLTGSSALAYLFTCVRAVDVVTSGWQNVFIAGRVNYRKLPVPFIANETWLSFEFVLSLFYLNKCNTYNAQFMDTVTLHLCELSQLCTLCHDVGCQMMEKCFDRLNNYRRYRKQKLPMPGQFE